jgi:hypothetical protein
MAKGAASPGPSQTTTVSNPMQQKLFSLAMPYAKDFAKSGGPELPGFSRVQGFDPLQTQGQEMVLGNTGTQQDVVGAAAQGNQFLSSGAALTPDSNPALQATIDASVRPIYQNLTETVLPKIRGGAVQTGNWGGSRQGIMEGLATARAGQTAADTAAKVATTGYLGGLDAMGKAQGQAGAVAGAQSIPGATTSGVGDVRQALAQLMLGERASDFNYEQSLPLMMAKEIMGLGAMVPAQGQTTTASVPQQNSTMQAVGMGMQLLPFLSMMSDRRTKEDIVQIGTLVNGLPVYRFRYLMDKQVRMGLMAQDVEQMIPDAVFEKNGIKFIDYPKVFDHLEGARA